MKNIIVLSFITLIFCIGCSKKEVVTPPTEVEIRVKNISNLRYTDLTVSTGGGQQNYGILNANATSDYKKYSFCYRYAFIQITIDGKTYTLQPFDYVSETKFETGKFTYEIDANTTNNRLSLNFVND
jgi:hypothetical protein